MPVTDLIGVLDATRSARLRGAGYFAGEAPDPSNPDSVDGRFRILNVPSRGRVVAYERGSMIPAAHALAAADGTWRIDWLDPARDYIVIGYDDTGAQNAAIQDWVRPEPYV